MKTTGTLRLVPAPPAQEISRSRWWNRYLQRFQENRKEERRPSGIAAEIWWSDDSATRVIARGICIDTSIGGMGLVSQHELPDGVDLHIKLQSGAGARCARLRHCKRLGEAYLAGVQFLVES